MNNIDLIHKDNYIYIDDKDQIEDSFLTWEEKEKSYTRDIEIKEEFDSSDENVDLKFYQELVNCESVWNDLVTCGASVASESDLSEYMNNDSEEIDVESIEENQSIINHNLTVLSTANDTTITLLPVTRTLRDRQKLKGIVQDMVTEIGQKKSTKRKKNKHKKLLPTVTKMETKTSRQKTKKRVSYKRIQHNTIEIQRRSELRNGLETLRHLVPELRDNDRASKVIILREATILCRQLAVTNRAQQQEFVELCREQERLSVRVSKLQR